jgi:plastocyanin
MQRRVATIYFVFFLVMGASAYSVIALADAPTMELEGEELSADDTLAVDNRVYTISTLEADEGEVTGELTWTNESARFSESIANGTTLSPVLLAFDGQAARHTATLANGDTIQFNGSTATVAVNVSMNQLQLLRDGNITGTVGFNESFAYQGNTTTLYEIDDETVTLVWGEPYTLTTTPERSVRATQQFDVATRLAADSGVENQTITRDDGREYVVVIANGSTQLLSEYLPTPDTATLAEGDSVTYTREDATVDNVSASEIRLEWTASQQNTIPLEQGTNITLGGQQHVVHFPNEEHVVLSPDVSGYQATVREQDGFQTRENGLWGVTILSGVASTLLIAMAFLPVKD